MQTMHIRILRRLKKRTFTELLVLVIALSVLSGCATDANIKPAPIVQEPALPAGPIVARLEDGREGFIITEVPQMDETSRKDFERAIALMKDQDYGHAIEILEKIIEKSPGVTAPYIDIAIAYRLIGKPEKAEEHLKAALQLVPDHPVASNEYALLCRKVGRFADARAIYEKAIAHFPEYYPMQRNFGILCDLYLNDPECALEHYEIYSEAKPEDKQVKMWIADLRTRLGRN
jgi:tetratricopeptide (TPR) repeat protein